MSWDDLDVSQEQANETRERMREKQVETAKLFHRCFETEEGQKVIQDLLTRFILDNSTPFNSPNVNYESAYHNGEAGVVRFILNQIRLAEEL